MRRKSIGIMGAIALVIGACGGGDGVEDTTTTTVAEQSEDSQTEGTQPAPTTTEAVKEGPPAPPGDEGTGTATIGDTTWEFSVEGGGTCQVEPGAPFFIIMFGVDDSGRPVTLNISGPPGGEAMVQAGSQNLEFERWTADSNVYNVLSGIEGMPDGVGATVQIDGNTISGSGVFYDDKNLNDVRPTGDPYHAGVLEGTFWATCPSE